MIDPWETLDHPRDTTLRLVEEAGVLRIPVALCDVRSIQLQGERVILNARMVLRVKPGRGSADFELSPAIPTLPGRFRQIHYRVDPPVNLAYLHSLQLLALGTRGTKTEIVNPPSALFSLNEKFEGAALSRLSPPSLVSSREEALIAFGKTHRRAVLKPLHQAASVGVDLLDFSTPHGVNAGRSILRALTHDFTQPALMQKYIEAISRGEQRLWFVDGKLLAHARKLPKQGDFRVNIDQGSQVVSSELSADEKKAVPRIGKHLREQGIRLAAVDLIDGWITDFNFTSPGLITQMEQVLGINLAKPILKSLLRSKPGLKR